MISKLNFLFENLSHLVVQEKFKNLKKIEILKRNFKEKCTLTQKYL